MLELEAEFPNQIFAMMGLHPCYVKPETWEKELIIVDKWFGCRKFVAIGEIGIDLYWDKTTLDIQIKAFEKQIDWAIMYDVPIVIHTRESFDETFEVLEKKKTPKIARNFSLFQWKFRTSKTSDRFEFPSRNWRRCYF